MDGGSFVVSNDAEYPPWLKWIWYGFLSGKGGFGIELLFEVKIIQL